MRILTTILMIALATASVWAQAYCLQFEVVSNDGSTLVLNGQMQGTEAFGIGDHNLVFSYNSNAVSNPTLVSHGLTDPFYGNSSGAPLSITPGGAGEASFNAEYLLSPNPGFAVTIPIANTSLDWITIFTVSFTIDNSSLDPQVAFLSPPNTVVFLYTNAFPAGLLTMEVDCPSFVLPIELVAFDARLMEEDLTRITWKTALERDNDHYQIQRSKTGTGDFETVGTVQGQGTTNKPTDYHYIDRFPFGVFKLYYRLKQVDFDGSVSFSDVKSVTRVPKQKIEIHPNPVKNLLQVGYKTEISDDRMKVQLYSASGVLVHDREFDMDQFAGVFDIQMNGLASGPYLLKIRGKNWLETRNIIKVD